MALPDFTMRQLLEAGVHFGHHTRRWNPKMAPYLFGVRNGVHIIDLEQTVPLLHRALLTVRDVVAGGGRVLFVGTKRQAANIIAESARRCGQYYVNHRWLGGMLTNWKTISHSIKRLKELDEKLAEENIGLTKKELLHLTRERDKLDRALGGIKEMGGLPDILFVIDTNKEAIAVREATKLNIPVVAVLDSNSDPTGIAYPIPGNDDAIRAVDLYCDLVAGAVIDGLQEELRASGADVGETEELPPEKVAEEGGAQPAETAATRASAAEGEQAAPAGQPERREAGEAAAAQAQEAAPTAPEPARAEPEEPAAETPAKKRANAAKRTKSAKAAAASKETAETTASGEGGPAPEAAGEASPPEGEAEEEPKAG